MTDEQNEPEVRDFWDRATLERFVTRRRMPYREEVDEAREQVKALLLEFTGYKTAVDRTLEKLEGYQASGMSMVNIRQVVNLLSAEWPHRNTEDEHKHLIQIREDGFTIQHPLACRPNLFDCPVNKLAQKDLKVMPPVGPGIYKCEINTAGVLVIGDRVDG